MKIAMLIGRCLVIGILLACGVLFVIDPAAKRAGDDAVTSKKPNRCACKESDDCKGVCSDCKCFVEVK